MHHALYWQGRHANTLNECITVCSHCHTQANHQENGKLWGLKPNVPRLEGAAYMNIVRWKLIDTLKENLPNIEIIHTYGSITSRTRKNLGLEKTHANDAYCIGKFFPKKRAETVYFKKIRRNNRCLEKFIDAKYIDTRTGKKVSAKDLSCGRTNRRESRNSEKNLRIFRGQKISKGRRNIRRSTYEIKSGDIVIYNNQKYLSHGIINKGEYVVLDSVKNVDIKDIKDVKSLEIGKYVQWQNQKTKRKILDINGDIITLQWNISVPNNPEYVKRFVKKDGWVKIKKNQKSKTKQPKINDSITKPLKTNDIIKKHEGKIQKIQLSLFDI